MSRLDDFLDQSIYVIDTETTGLDGYPRDVVVDIAVCKVDPRKGTVDEIYSSVVGHDVSRWNDERKNAWIFQNTDLSLDMVASAPPAEKVASDIRKILSGKNVTTFNTGFDLDKFLYHEPWSLKGKIIPSRCIMLASKNVCRLPGLYEEYKWPKLEEAYSIIVDGDPAGINGEQTHRALSDAVMASHILIALCRNGRY
jgi:DNA polymerase-3 subunit epsilon